MTRRAILQIGTEKTGTTTLQHFLALNRERLAARGFCYPRFPGELNHTGLAAYALDAAKSDPIRALFGYREPADLHSMRERIRQAAESELADGADAIFCNEHCHSRLQSREEIRRLRTFLSPLFDDVQVCIYLRRQDRVALSLYTTQLKSGSVPPRLLPNTSAVDPYFNYDLSLAAWEDEFGREAVHVRLFDRAELVGGSIVTDFVHCWSLGEPDDFLPVPDKNAAIRPAAQAFLAHVNPHIGASGGLPSDLVRGPLVSLLERWMPGRGALPCREEAERFYAIFRASNDKVCRRYFPDRDALFDESFESYPPEAEPTPDSLDSLAAISGRLLVAVQGEVCRLEAEVAIRDAQLLWQRNERSAAIAALRRALDWQPRHADAWRTLGEYLLRDDRPEEASGAADAAVRHRPDAAEFWHFLGIARRRAGAMDAALEAQERALVLDPDHAGAARERDQLTAHLVPPAETVCRPVPARESHAVR